MRVFGLTGGIGSGKSTVARMFAEEGIPVVDADRIAREVTAPGRPAYDEIVRIFGRGILSPDGVVDRKKLGEIVFSDAAKRTRLEEATHPRIVEGIGDALRELASKGHAAALVEAALIHETGRRGLIEAVIAVESGREQQVSRLAARDGMPREEALRRIAAQMDPREKSLASDHVIDNSGDLASTRAQVRALAARLRQARGHS